MFALLWPVVSLAGGASPDVALQRCINATASAYAMKSGQEIQFRRTVQAESGGQTIAETRDLSVRLPIDEVDRHDETGRLHVPISPVFDPFRRYANVTGYWSISRGLDMRIGEGDLLVHDIPTADEADSTVVVFGFEDYTVSMTSANSAVAFELNPGNHLLHSNSLWLTEASFDGHCQPLYVSLAGPHERRLTLTYAHSPLPWI